MRATLAMRVTGVLCIAGGIGLINLFFSQGGCLGDNCNSRPLPGTAPHEVLKGLLTVSLLLAAGTGLFIAARRRMPIRNASLAVATCAGGGAVFAIAAGVTVAKTGGETWLMPLFVFPALGLITAAWIIIGVVVLGAELVPRRLAVALIVAASLLPIYQQQTPGNFIPGIVGLVWVALGAHLVYRGGQPGHLVDDHKPGRHASA